MAKPQIRAYDKTAAEYAELYSVSLSTIQRWKQLNAPLDDSSRMSAWVQVNTQKPPASFTAEDYDDEESEDEGSASLDGVEIGVRAEIKSLELACAKARIAYQSAKSDIQREAKLKHWSLLTEQVRKLQKDTPRSEKDDGKTVQITDVSESITRALVGLRKEIEALPQSLAMSISHLPQATIIEVEMAAKSTVDDIISSMEKGTWLEL